MNLPSPRARTRARIEIVPLIDIVFFLLATFVMVSLSMVKSRTIPVQLPAAATSVAEDRSERVSLALTEAGDLYWNEDRIARDSLPARLAALRAATPDAKVFLRGDVQAHVGDLVHVLDEVRAAGIAGVAIETKPAP